jgi:hypothetical protein
MSRANKRDTEIRHALEAIGAELAVLRNMNSITRIRVKQAQDRTGLNDLLSPVQGEMDEVVKCTGEIGKQVRVALAWLEQ